MRREPAPREGTTIAREVLDRKLSVSSREGADWLRSRCPSADLERAPPSTREVLWYEYGRSSGAACDHPEILEEYARAAEGSEDSFRIFLARTFSQVECMLPVERHDDSSMTIHVATTDAQIVACHSVMRELRPHVAEAQFLSRIRSQERAGYRLVYVREPMRVASLHFSAKFAAAKTS